MKVLTVVGNRPQFIKAAAVSGPLRSEHEEVLVHTGQHFDDELSAGSSQSSGYRRRPGARDLRRFEHVSDRAAC